tara:strand:+ start:340 stop:633 length:294 start_codon:yes stop_codon:yes gene_type:complete
MDNKYINDENLKRLGKYIAESLFDLSRDTDREDWLEENMRDYAIGELARCVTLQNLYLDREEFEKCALMKIRIMELSDQLDLPIDPSLTDLDKDDEE